jgi:hypothetical protein
MSQEFEVLNYVDAIGEERNSCTLYLEGKTKLHIMLHPFKTLNCKLKLKKLDEVDNQFRMIVASSLNKEDYKKKAHSFIVSHPLTPNRNVI